MTSKRRLSFLAANPRDKNLQLRQLEEFQRIQRELGRSRMAHRIELVPHLTARVEDLDEVVKVDQPELLHFSGIEADTTGGILLEDERGLSVPVSSEELLNRLSLQDPPPRFVFLNCCYSVPTASTLITRVDAAIGYYSLVADDYANAFADAFYSSLFDGATLLGAYDFGITEMQRSEHMSQLLELVNGRPPSLRLNARHADAVESFRVFTAEPVRVFISYGGPDEPFAKKLHHALEERGIDAFCFTDDAVPGRPLHRVMHEGVTDHDWVVLLCSKDSLDRPGVLTELEESLRRAARSGGENPLIPIALDDYVFSDWSPPRPDLATYVRDLVIGDFQGASEDEVAFEEAFERLLGALTA